MCKAIVEGKVLRNFKIADSIYKMIIFAPDVASLGSPGQFVNVYPKARHTLLPRPISLCAISGDLITLVYGVVGSGTLEFSGYKEGDAVKLSTPQGNGFDCEPAAGLKNFGVVKKRQVILVGGGLGVPPLIALAERLIAQGDQVEAVVGFREEPYLLDDLTDLGVTLHVTTDLGSFGSKGTVMDYIRKHSLTPDYYYACGPKAMLQALSAYCAETGIPVQVSMEERMGCGYGACVGCVCKVQNGYKKICTDGPVFLGKDVDWHA